jgi:hypothetical protein
MRTTMMWTTAGVLLTAFSATAQDAPRPAIEADPAREQVFRLRESRYQIGQMERVLEGAVEHGATIIRDRLQAVVPADMLLTENARVRGFRLEGYGIFFDVQVPSLEGTLLWAVQTLDQNDLTLDNALKTMRSFAATTNDTGLQQAIKRIELQVAPVGARTSILSPSDGRNGASTPATAPKIVRDDPILKNPAEAYRAAIREALVDAMLEHTRGLGVGPNELLTVAARRSEDRPRLAPADQDAQTVLISVRGSDLTAFLGGQLSREEAMKRVVIRVF